MSDSSSEREVAATRAQIELARLLNVPFAGDYQSREHALTEHTGHVSPGLPDEHGLVTVEVALPIETLLALVDGVRRNRPSQG